MKKFLIIGNMNAIAYKEIFPLIMDNKIWLGQNAKGGTRKGNSLSFTNENGELKDISSWWYTNIDCVRHNTFIDLYKHYNKEEYPKYDNYNAINVNKTKDIPYDYNACMGVPISFLMFHCPEQFEIIDLNPHFFSIVESGLPKPKQLTLHNVGKKNPYARVLIKKKDMKKFLIIGNMNAITYKEIFPLLKNNCIWMGTTYFNGGATHFIAPKEIFGPNKMYNEKNAFFDENGNFMWRVNGVRWFTNLSNNNHKIPITLTQTYSSDKYPKYDNYNAINVNKVSDIPMDYDGVMGVPITFLDKYCPEQFEIIWTTDRGGDGKINYLKNKNFDKSWDSPYINGNKIYKRILIKRRFIDINI